MFLCTSFYTQTNPIIITAATTANQDGRVKFDTWLRAHMLASGAVLPFPADGFVFDYRLVEDGTAAAAAQGDDSDTAAAALAASVVVAWKHWMRDEPAYAVDVTQPFARLIVPTLDTVRVCIVCVCV